MVFRLIWVHALLSLLLYIAGCAQNLFVLELSYLALFRVSFFLSFGFLDRSSFDQFEFF
jgi:hypothetical protein